MQKILFLIEATLPKRFTRKQFNATIREHSITSHPHHYLQRLVDRGILKRYGQGLYELV